MKINRKNLEWYLKNIRRKYEGKELTDTELVNELANWMEINPACVDMGEASHSGRFSYHQKLGADTARAVCLHARTVYNGCEQA